MPESDVRPVIISNNFSKIFGITICQLWMIIAIVQSITALVAVVGLVMSS